MQKIPGRIQRRARTLLAASSVSILAIAGAAAAEAPSAFSPERLSFLVRYHDEASSLRVNAVFVLPGEALAIEVIDPLHSASPFAVEVSAGTLRQTAPASWTWTAPDGSSLYPIVVRRESNGESMLLNVFVEVPASRLEGESLNGYRIGRYPATPLDGLAVYRAPSGFIEVTAENAGTLVSPHFRLEQFLCKQASGYPKYVVLQERLLRKLELLLERVNLAGFRTDTLYVMSGYRTPFYNQSIGNVRNSRHIYGGAADVFVDTRRADGVMDDLDGNGRADNRDTSILARMVEDLERDPSHRDLVGGLGLYEATSAHGPFLHVDERGRPARWGAAVAAR